MYTMAYDITVGDYRIGMLDAVEIHKSVELLADTAEIRLPAMEYNVALEVEGKIKRGDAVSIKFGYKETGLVEEFRGWLQKITTDNGTLKLVCEDDLFRYRKGIRNEVLKKAKLADILKKVVEGTGTGDSINCSYDWTYSKFVINNATGYDVLKKIQEECGADIYVRDGVLHLHPPGEVVGTERIYDFSLNVEENDLTYRTTEDDKFLIVVKALMPDGSVKEIEVGSTGGDKVEVKSPSPDSDVMRQRGEAELKRRSFNGYDGSITTWLIPECRPGDTAVIHDRDYPQKDGTYFVNSVTTTFSKEGGKRKIEIGFRLS